MNNPKTIAMITYPGIPEMDARASAMATSLASLGHQVTVLTRHHGNGSRENRDGVTLRHMAAGPADPLGETDALPHLAEFVDTVTRKLNRDRFDVLHSYGWLAGLGAQLAADRADSPRPALVHTFDHLHLIDGTDPATGQPTPGSRLRAERVVAQQADHLVLSHTVHQAALLRAGVPRSRMTVVPPALDSGIHGRPRVSPPHRPVSARGRTIVFCGGLPHQPAELNEIVRPLTRNPDAELLICDTPAEPAGPGVELLTAIGARYGVHDRIHTTDPEPDELRAELCGATIVVSGERAGLMHLEAMATGVPVIATSHQVAEAVVDNTTGLHLLTPGHRGLGRAIWGLMANHTARQAMALAGIDRIRTRYDSALITAELNRVYDRVYDRVRAPNTPTGQNNPDDQIAQC